MRSFAKKIAALTARVLVFPAACCAGFGRWGGFYLFFAHFFALAPGLFGSYLRIAYYALTLDRGAGKDCQVGFGSYFVYPSASFADRVGIGAYCVLGHVDIGEGTLLGSGVQILSGSRQHRRDDTGRLTDEGRTFRRIAVGPNCWIGAGAIIMADIGEGATIGPGSVVNQDAPKRVTLSGNPARNFAMVIPPSA